MTVDTYSYCSGHMLMRVTGLQEGERKTKTRGRRGRNRFSFRVRGHTTWRSDTHTQGCGGVLADILLQYCRGQCKILRNSGFTERLTNDSYII